MAGSIQDDIRRFQLEINTGNKNGETLAQLTKFEKETAKLRNENTELQKVMGHLAATGRKNTDEYKRMDAQLKANKKTIAENSVAMKGLQKNLDLNYMSMGQLRKRSLELRSTLNSMSKAANPEEYNRLEKELGQVGNQMDKLKGKGKQTQGFLVKMKETAKGLFPIVGIGAFVAGLKSIKDKTIEVRAQFSKYEAILKNTLGSQKAANAAFAELQSFAAKTPFQLDELTGSYVKLANQGFKPTMDEMTNMGDLAAAMGKSFDQLTEAVIDAQVGENERLKEFGIRAQKNGDKIKYTFKGVTTEVDNNAQAIQKYILSLGNLEGVQGGMAAISKTIGGAMSNAADATDSLFNAIGKRLEPSLVKAYTSFSSFISRIAKSIEPQKAQVNLYGIQNREVNNLFNTLQSANLSQSARNKLITEINTKYGEYLPNLLTEKSTINEIADAQKRVNDQIRIKIISQAMQDEIIEALKQEKEAVESLVVSEISAAEASTQLLTETDQGKVAQLELQKKYSELNKNYSEGVIKNATDTETKIKEKYKKIAEYYRIAFEEIEKASNLESPNPDEGNGGKGKKEAEEQAWLTFQKNIYKEALEMVKGYAGSAEAFKKQYGLYGSIALMNQELEAFEKNEESKFLSAEQWAKARADIMAKYTKVNPIVLEPEEEVEEEAALQNFIATNEQIRKLKDQYSKYSIDELEAEELAFFEKNFALLEGTELYEQTRADIENKYRQIRIESDQIEKEKKIANAVEYFALLQTGAQQIGEAIQSLQNMELEAIQNKVDKGLMSEEQGKKEEIKIKKKYADMQFIATASQIISSTSLAIMQAWAQLGPIAGPIMAGIAGIAGGIQLAASNKQRQRVKQLYTGGYTGAGGKYEPKQLIQTHGNEYVMPSEAVNNPNIKPFIDIMEQQRVAGTIGTMRLPVVTPAAAGGFAGSQSQTQLTSVLDSSSMLGVVQQFSAAVDKLQRGVPAYFNDATTRDITEQQALDKKLTDKARFAP
jgi:hypothetical protein